MSTDHNNDTFERMLIDACKANLKPTIDPYTYANVVLDEMFNNGTYTSPDSTPYYYEISKHDTYNMQPIVVHLQQ